MESRLVLWLALANRLILEQCVPVLTALLLHCKATEFYIICVWPGEENFYPSLGKKGWWAIWNCQFYRSEITEYWQFHMVEPKYQKSQMGKLVGPTEAIESPPDHSGRSGGGGHISWDIGDEWKSARWRCGGSGRVVGMSQVEGTAVQRLSVMKEDQGRVVGTSDL